jgi:tetratricopeptide (TPR) repeat protein
MFELDPEVARIAALYESEEFDEALRGSEALLAQGTDGLTLSSKARLMGCAGLCMLKVGRSDDALMQLSASFDIDPTDRDVAAGLGQLLMQGGRRAEAAAAFEALLLHHRDGLTPNSLRTVLTHLAAWYVESEQIQRARARLEEALELDSEHPLTLRPLLEVYDQLGMVSEAGEVRLRLLEKLPDGQEKALLAQTQGRALLDAGRRIEAVDWLLTSWRVAPDAAIAEEVSELLEQTGRIEEAVQVLRVASAAEDPAGRRVLSLRRARLLADSLGRPTEASTVLETMLDANPRDLELFERIVNMLASAKMWTELHDAYARMIGRLIPLGEGSLNGALHMMWKNIGQINEDYLNDIDGALTSLHEASRYGRDDELDQRMVELAPRVSDPSLLVSSMRAVWTREIRRVGAGEHLAAALLKTNETDQGYLALQTVNALGGLDGKPGAAQTLKRLRSTRRWKFTTPLHGGLREKYLNPAASMTAMRTVIGVAWQLLGESFARSLDEYDLRPRDAIDMSKPTLVARLWLETSRNLGHESIPAIFPHEGVDTIACAFTTRPSVLIHPRFLSPDDDREVRFLVGRQLALMENECMLPVLLGRDELAAVLACMINAIRPEFERPATEFAERMSRALRRNLNDAWRRPLEMAVAQFFETDDAANVTTWQQGMAVEVNRTGLICSDAPEVAMRLASEAPVFATPMDGTALAADLAHFAWSERYSELRKRLGIAAGS